MKWVWIGLLVLGQQALHMMDVSVREHFSVVGNGFFYLDGARAFHIGFWVAIAILYILTCKAIR